MFREIEKRQGGVTEGDRLRRLTACSGETVMPVQGDCVQVQQVVLNLVLNAVEAMRLVEAGARGLVISTEKTKTGGALVAVRDSGPGIDPEHLERVFEAFYTTKSSGTGMGVTETAGMPLK